MPGHITCGGGGAEGDADGEALGDGLGLGFGLLGRGVSGANHVP